MTGWQHINTAPKDGTLIDLWVWCGDHDVDDCYFPKMYWHSDGHWYSYADVFEAEVVNADHWRPITGPAS